MISSESEDFCENIMRNKKNYLTNLRYAELSKNLTELCKKDILESKLLNAPFQTVKKFSICRKPLLISTFKKRRNTRWKLLFRNTRRRISRYKVIRILLLRFMSHKSICNSRLRYTASQFVTCHDISLGTCIFWCYCCCHCFQQDTLVISCIQLCFICKRACLFLPPLLVSMIKWYKCQMTHSLLCNRLNFLRVSCCCSGCCSQVVTAFLKAS